MSNATAKLVTPKGFRFKVAEAAAVGTADVVQCVIGEHIRFSTAVLESFASRNWDQRVYDALVLTAAIEFCDRSAKRSAHIWGRSLSVQIPVHDPDLWNAPAVMDPLISALTLLTGDQWIVTFYPRTAPADRPAQSRLEFPTDVEAAIPFSNGMDSLAVGALEEKRLNGRIARVRVVSGIRYRSGSARRGEPFAALPYKVDLRRDNAETSARSRGFKFCLVAALGAYLVDAPIVIVPESGQGALGPSIIVVGQGYSDYRNHPAFTVLIASLVKAVLGHDVRFVFPRLWSTKGETLRDFVDSQGPDDRALWLHTRSCWQQSRQVSIDGKQRQCGVCAACLLRRMSIHAAGLEDDNSNYVWEDLTAATFSAGASAAFERTRITGALREYALAGALHLEHLANLSIDGQFTATKARHSRDIAHALGQPLSVVMSHFDELLRKHRSEWESFVRGLGTRSFIQPWLE